MNKKNKDLNKNESLAKTFSVPWSLVLIEEELTISTNNSMKLTKIQIRDKAIKLHREGNFSEAAKYYQDLINQGFKDHKVFSNYGTILKSNGKLKEAEILQRKAINVTPNLAEAYYNLSNTLKDIGKLTEAEMTLLKAITEMIISTEAKGTILSMMGLGMT